MRAEFIVTIYGAGVIHASSLADVKHWSRPSVLQFRMTGGYTSPIPGLATFTAWRSMVSGSSKCNSVPR